MSTREEILLETDEHFHEIVTNPDTLQEAAQNLLDKIIDDITRGVIFGIHRELKNDTPTLENSPPTKEVDSGNCNEDMLETIDTRKYYCVCSSCAKKVKAVGFAPHLQNCMGLGTSRSRSTHRTAKTNGESSTSSVYKELSDDDDIQEKPKKRKKKVGSKAKPITKQG